MRCRADEHVSPRIVRALREVSLASGWELTCVRDVHPTRTADETWMARFAAEEGKGIITADAAILRRPHQIAAVQASGLFGLILPSTWAQSQRHVQAASLVLFWPKIAEAFDTAQPGDFWKLPNALLSGSLQKITVNYAAAAAAAAVRRP